MLRNMRVQASMGRKSFHGLSAVFAANAAIVSDEKLPVSFLVNAKMINEFSIVCVAI